MKITLKAKGIKGTVSKLLDAKTDEFEAKVGSETFKTPHLLKALNWAERQMRLQVSS